MEESGRTQRNKEKEEIVGWKSQGEPNETKKKKKSLGGRAGENPTKHRKEEIVGWKSQEEPNEMKKKEKSLGRRARVNPTKQRKRKNRWVEEPGGIQRNEENQEQVGLCRTSVIINIKKRQG